MKRSKSDYSIQTVANALRVLEQFHRDEELGVTELSRRLSLHKNNVFRLLATLAEQGYVEQFRGSERYRLGPACVELGRAFLRGGGLPRVARPELETLARQTGETVHLALLDRAFRVVHLDGCASDQLIGTVLRVGQSLDAHCTALGKVLLAVAEPALLERFDRDRIGSGELPRHTPATIVDREKLFEHLRTVAGQGYAVDVEECAPGLSCAAAPIHDQDGAVVGALSVSGPVFRLDERMLHEVAAARVLEAAQRVSSRLGGPAQPVSV